jgi:exo-beta-1,3-glucanase (GH17 family)
MSNSLGRTFSFNDDDESSLDPNRPNYLSHDNNAFRDQPSPPSTYTDSPTRHYNDSPPPPPVHRAQSAFSYQLPDATDSTDNESSRPQISVNTRQAQGGNQGLDHSTSNRTVSTITPGADNMGEAAAGGINGIAMGVANTNERESGVEALRSLERIPEGSRGLPPEHGYDTPREPPSSYRAYSARDPFSSPAPSRGSNPFDDGRSLESPSPGDLTPRGYPSTHSIPMSDYPPHDVYENNARGSFTDNPYKRFSTAWDDRVARGDINPEEIEDDGDDINAPPTRQRSMLGLGNRAVPEGAVAGAAGGSAAGGVLGALGGLVGRSNNASNGTRDLSSQYGPVPGSSSGPGYGFDVQGVEKSPWLSKQTSGGKRLRWIVGVILALVIIGAIVGGVIAGLKSRKSSGSPSDLPTSPSTATDSDLDMNSAQIKKLMNNTKLHRVFPGMDYTPFNAQYPACLSNPPSQDNVTMDIAVLSQLTNTVRLYGTDCNQTEMVLHAISKLALSDMKVWLGVWIDKNATTNSRGISAMYDILTKNGADPFAGVIVGNEVLYRQQMTEAQLATLLNGVRTNLTNQKIDLPVAISDLGDAWTAGLEAATDVVMSNIHPFFAGVNASIASGWTWDFWQKHDTVLTAGSSKKNVISETGWPSGGGTDCGSETVTTCPDGSVAGIAEMNEFMDTFICQSLANGTNYFW